MAEEQPSADADGAFVKLEAAVMEYARSRGWADDDDHLMDWVVVAQTRSVENLDADSCGYLMLASPSLPAHGQLGLLEYGIRQAETVLFS